jgi:hypothetical protein
MCSLRNRCAVALVLLALPLGGVGLTGCTTVPEPQWRIAAESPLIVARSGRQAILRWRSEPGYRYTVTYSDGSESVEANWQPLPGLAQIRGTGREIEVADEMPAGVMRYYLLMVEKLD